MPTSAFALASVIANPPDRGKGGVRSQGARPLALGLAAAVHAVIGAVFVYDGRRPESVAAPERAIEVMLLPLAPDHSASRPRHGVAAKAARPEQVVAAPPSPVLVPARPSPPINVVEPEVAPPAPIEGGEVDHLDQATQAYRSALMARLEAERRYPRLALLDGYQGAGVVVFHIDRHGRLLDARIEVGTGRKALDRAALDMVRRAAPYPVIPREMPDQLEVSLPIRFLIVAAGATASAP